MPNRKPVRRTSARTGSGAIATVQQSVVGIAYDAIAERIASGQLGASERLTEARLMKELGVSRGAVREAMSKLASDGLIYLELNKGAAVRALSRKDLADFLQVRALFESFAARRAAERIDEPGNQEHVLAIIRECEALEASPTVAGFIANDTSFHATIMDLSGNAIMSAEWRRLRRSQYRLSFLRSLTREEILGSVSVHRQILTAILEGNAETAAELAGRHVKSTDARIRRLTDEQFDAVFNPQPIGPKPTRRKRQSRDTTARRS